MKKYHPTLEQVKATNPASITTHKKYSCSDIIVGKGSFGQVFLGWTKDGSSQVAVKVIDKNFLKQDKKVKENLDREISILKLMERSGCDYVVKMMDALKYNGSMIIVMEMCDYDLDDLLKLPDSFKEEQIIIDFLYQLAAGMRVLRKHNVVHRDIKPSNILIKECKDKKIFKLADFGFARHFRDDANKEKIMLQSAAGTPVYMAPEALQVVIFSNKKFYYDDKVDVWSIGALLYRVIVGECGFYAQLNQIYDFLKHKGDAIAFERSNSPTKVRYIYELPSHVSTRLSEPFCLKMNRLLCSMLKIDPRERIPFHRFFDFVDDIITSKIEVINILQGTSLKIVSDSSVSPQTLIEKVCAMWQIPPPHELIIFSTSSAHYITANRALSKAEFQELLNKSGGTHGHAILYILPTHQLQKGDLVPDVSCLDPFKFAIENNEITHLIIKQRFCFDIVHMIECLKLQLKAQLEGLEKLKQFTIQQIGLSMDYARLTEEVHQTLAKVTLTWEWVQKEMTIFLDEGSQSRLYPFVELLEGKRREIQELADELRNQSIPEPGGTSFNYGTYDEHLSKYIDYAKGMIKAPKADLHQNGKELYEYCVEIIQSATKKTRDHLLPYSKTLDDMRSLYERSHHILDVSELLSSVAVERQIMLTMYAGGGGGGGDDCVSGDFNDVSGDRSMSPQHSLTGQLNKIEDQTREIEQLKKKLAKEYESKLEIQNRLDEALVRKESLELRTLEIRVKEDLNVEEKTLKGDKEEDGNNIFSDTSVGQENAHLLGDLTQQLKIFCAESQKINKDRSEGACVSPDMTDGMEEHSVHDLISMAQRLAESLKDSIPTLRGIADKADSLVRFGNPCEYEEGDIAAFVPIMTTQGYTIPGIFHLQCENPNILMDVRSYEKFEIKPGKMPELFFAKLTETPRQMKLENHRSLAQSIGKDTGDFYRVIAEPIDLKFSGSLPLSSPIQRQLKHKSSSSSSASKSKRDHR